LLTKETSKKREKEELLRANKREREPYEIGQKKKKGREKK